MNSRCRSHRGAKRTPRWNSEISWLTATTSSRAAVSGSRSRGARGRRQHGRRDGVELLGELPQQLPCGDVLLMLRSWPAVRSQACWRSASAMTQLPMPTMTSSCSIRGQELAGHAQPSTGCCQRMSASRPTTRPFRQSTWAGSGDGTGRRRGRPRSYGPGQKLARTRDSWVGSKRLKRFFSGQLCCVHRLVSVAQQLLRITASPGKRLRRCWR